MIRRYVFLRSRSHQMQYRIAYIGYVQEIETICDQASVDANLCTEEQIGSFILASNATEASNFPIVSKAVHLNNPSAVNYPVKKTGFFCVSTFGYSGRDYTALVEFRNAYGELPAAQIAKLPFYGGLTIVYAMIGAYVCISFFKACLEYVLTTI